MPNVAICSSCRELAAIVLPSSERSSAEVMRRPIFRPVFFKTSCAMTVGS